MQQDTENINKGEGNGKKLNRKDCGKEECRDFIQLLILNGNNIERKRRANFFSVFYLN
jgi:hypothetical protein